MLIVTSRQMLGRLELHQQVCSIRLAGHTASHLREEHINRNKMLTQHRVSKRISKEKDEVSLSSALSRILPCPA